MLNYIIDEIIERREFEIIKGHQPHNAIMILLEGSFSCSISNGPSFIANPGDFIVFPIDCEFERHVIEPCRIYLVYYSIDLSPDLRRRFPCGKLEYRNSERAESNKNTLIDLLRRSDEVSDLIRQHVLDDIICQHFYESSPSLDPTAKISPGVYAVIDYMNRNIETKISLTLLADLAEMSKNSLIKHFRNEIGCTPCFFLSELRLQKAKSLILHTGLSISQVSEKCGYDNLYYFSNSFKKRFGVSPSSMRAIRPEA